MTEPAAPDPPRKTRRGIPLLVWVVLGLLVVWLIVALAQRKGDYVSPQGGTHPEQAEGASVMPAAPATSEAPGTPAGVVNGPNQPAPSKP